MLLVHQAGRRARNPDVGNVERRRDIARDGVVAIHRHRAAEPVVVSCGLAFGDDDRTTLFDRAKGLSRDSSIVYALDQNVALCTQACDMQETPTEFADLLRRRQLRVDGPLKRRRAAIAKSALRMRDSLRASRRGGTRPSWLSPLSAAASASAGVGRRRE